MPKMSLGSAHKAVHRFFLLKSSEAYTNRGISFAVIYTILISYSKNVLLTSQNSDLCAGYDHWWVANDAFKWFLHCGSYFTANVLNILYILYEHRFRSKDF